MYYNRIYDTNMESLSAQFPAILVTGPRQVGKTTLLRYLGRDQRTYLSLDEISVRELAKEDPKLFLQQYIPPLIIDEIQYAPELLPYLKIEIDKNKMNGAMAGAIFETYVIVEISKSWMYQVNTPVCIFTVIRMEVRST